MKKEYKIEYGGRSMSIEIGRVAKQADGSCMVKYGDTVVLVTVCRAKEAAGGKDFLPLTVNYMEMTYAAGKIPGGFFKREGRPSEREVLCSRLIDRPLRPLFPKGYFNETQIIATVMSLDPANDPAVAALVGASVALVISDIPFYGPAALAAVGRVEGELICNPSLKEQKESDINLLVAGTKEAVIMVEGGARFVAEDEILEAVEFAHNSMRPIFELQDKIAEDLGCTKLEPTKEVIDYELNAKVNELVSGKINEAFEIRSKQERYQRLKDIFKDLTDCLGEEYEGRGDEISKIFGDMKSDIVRNKVLDSGIRIDGRNTKDVRPITCEVGVLPRTHGSALFTRGETQAMVVTTLGTSDDEQKIDALSGWEYKRFMLHYNFPPFSVGEVKFLRGPGRREIGHGVLAERAVASTLPDADTFPYTVRVVSDILESNGSSSMASVCGASLSLMDAGVPTSSAIAGIAMGLIKDGEKVAILSDILGDEDHLGDMDFKVAGNEDGITAFQMDTKIGGIPATILKDALYQAREGRLHILNKMKEAIDTPRKELSIYAPRIISINVRQEKIKDVIGPGGKVIRGIIAKTGVKIDIDDTGKVNIASSDGEAMKQAVKIIEEITKEAEVGKIYTGTVKKVVDFGAFVEIFPGTEGLVHISQLADRRVKDVTEILKEGDEVPVKVIDISNDGKIRLSRKEALVKAEM